MKTHTTNKEETNSTEAKVTQISRAMATILPEARRPVFIRFMELRFPDEWDASYIGEWRTRFDRGSPHRFMDSDSLDAYNRALKENGFAPVVPR